MFIDFIYNIITWIAIKLLYSWIYLYHSPTDLHNLWPHIYANELSTSGRRCWSRRARGFPINGSTQKRAPLTNAALSDIICKMKWKWHLKFSANSWFPSEISDIKTPALGFDFETCSAQPSVLPTCQPVEFPEAGFTISDVTKTGKQLCSPNKPFVVVLEKVFFLNEISPFGVDFEICNFADRFMPKPYSRNTD